MIKPAILYKEQIKNEFQKYFYTTDMMFFCGYDENFCPEIEECPKMGLYQYAVVNDQLKLIGYITYQVDYYASEFPRAYWTMVGGNIVERHYDAFCKKHNGTKHILRDTFKDKEGKYHNSIIYEIIKEGK